MFVGPFVDGVIASPLPQHFHTFGVEWKSAHPDAFQNVDGSRRATEIEEGVIELRRHDSLLLPLRSGNIAVKQ